jgi:hypothetical protein
MTTDSRVNKNSTSSCHTYVKQLADNTNRIHSNAQQVIRQMPVLLSEQQISRLREHCYASEGTTLLDPCMQYFWKWLVNYCPLWVAPNLLTIVGLVINIGTSILLMICTNGAKEQVTFVFEYLLFYI